MRKSTGRYPKNWKAIAKRIKEKNHNCCERCGHPHDKPSGHVLTCHHLDYNRSNCKDWNLAALCQKCHLIIQARFWISQMWMFDNTEPWMKPHIDGYLAWVSSKVVKLKR